jgi:hypothetical protein
LRISDIKLNREGAGSNGREQGERAREQGWEQEHVEGAGSKQRCREQTWEQRAGWEQGARIKGMK